MTANELFTQAKSEIDAAFGISTNAATIMIIEGVKMGIKVGQKITQEVELKFASAR
jgi:hypothetical protein